MQDQIQSCRQVLVLILTQPDLLLCQHPAYHISLLRNHNILTTFKGQPEFTKWLQRLKALLQCRHNKSHSEDTIDLSSDVNRHNSSIELGWWAASLYLAETVASCPDSIITDSSEWLTALARLSATNNACRIAVLQAFSTVCVAAADAGNIRIDVVMQQVSPFISQLTTTTTVADPSLALVSLDVITKLSSALHKAIRQHSSKMLAYAFAYADHDDDDVRTAAARAVATVTSLCSPAVNLFDYVGGLDRLLDRYLLQSLSNDTKVVEDDAPFTTPLQFGAVPIVDALKRWRFLCDIIRAVLDDDTAAVSIPIENVLQTLARVMHLHVPSAMLGTITSHPISCLNLFSSLPSLQAEMLTILASLCRRLYRRLVPFGVMIGDMLSALPLERVLIAMPAATAALGTAILDPVIIPSLRVACHAIQEACIMPAAIVVDNAIQRGKKRSLSVTDEVCRTPSAHPIAPYIDFIISALQHVGDRLPHDTLQAITTALNTAVTSPCLIRDRRRLFLCFRELLSARYRQAPDLALLRQAGRIFASGQFGRDADVCCQGLAFVQHLAAPAVPVAVHQRVQVESILNVEMSCDSTPQGCSTVTDDRPAASTAVVSLDGFVSPQVEAVDYSVINIENVPEVTDPANPRTLDPNPNPKSTPEPMKDVSKPPLCVPDERRDQLDLGIMVPDVCSRLAVSDCRDEQRLVGVKRKEPEPIVRASGSEAALLVDIGPDEADDQAPLWRF